MITVPLGLEGVIVTGITTVFPGSTSTGVSDAVGSTLRGHKSPVAAVIPWSNASVVAIMEVCAITGRMGDSPFGPTSVGWMSHTPEVTGDG